MESELPQLDAIEARVIGCLIEKQAATPENYPLTENAVVTACNQKTSREPVMKLDPGRAGQTLRKLEQRGLVERVTGARADRWHHRADGVYRLTPGQRVLIGLMLLRGPQTVNELLTRSARMHAFEDAEEVRFQLERLAQHDLVVRLGRQPGQREERYMHLLSGPVDPDSLPKHSARPASEPEPIARDDLLERIEALEERMAALEERLADEEAPPPAG